YRGRMGESGPRRTRRRTVPVGGQPAERDVVHEAAGGDAHTRQPVRAAGAVRRLPRVVSRLGRRGILRALTGPRSRRTRDRLAEDVSWWVMAASGPVESGRPPLVAATDAPVLRLRFSRGAAGAVDIE